MSAVRHYQHNKIALKVAIAIGLFLWFLSLL